MNGTRSTLPPQYAVWNSRLIRLGWLAGLLVTLLSSAAWADWTVKREQNQAGQLERCVLISDMLSVHDGYQDTQVYLMVSPDAIVVKTKAPLDDGFADIGLQVDKNDFIKMDNVVAERSALFASSYAKILEQFKKGSAPVKKGQKPPLSKVRVQLRFWPTWPATGTHDVEFGLADFSKAYADMVACTSGK